MENQKIADELSSVDPATLNAKGPGFKATLNQIRADWAKTTADLRKEPGDMLSNDPAFMNRLTAHMTSKGKQGLKELMSAVRLGSIYLRPAYLPNNWIGNTAMNMIHQGFLAPVELAKSVVMHNRMSEGNVNFIDRAMGANPAQVGVEGMPRGYIGAVGHPLAETMGKYGDQPFRRAAFLHELRREGYPALKDVDELINKARGGDQEALKVISNAARRGQEEIVKFGKMRPGERQYLSNAFFVYNWVKGSTRYAARFPFQHPTAFAGTAAVTPEGKAWVQHKAGGVPWFMAGAIPVGRDKSGNPLMINPMSLSPAGSAVDLARAAGGTYKAIFDPKHFDKYNDPTFVDMLQPPFSVAVKHMMGEDKKPIGQELAQTQAWYRLYHTLKHPGSGTLSTPTQGQAIGKYILGSSFPTTYSQQGLTAAVTREKQNDPVALLDQQVSDLQKKTGMKVSPQEVAAIRGDLEAEQHIKDFQANYAQSVGSTGFKNLPGANQVEAAIKYLQQVHGITDAQAQQYADMANRPGIPNAELLQISHNLWKLTHVGEYSKVWKKIVKSSQAGEVVPKRK